MKYYTFCPLCTLRLYVMFILPNHVIESCCQGCTFSNVIDKATETNEVHFMNNTYSIGEFERVLKNKLLL